MAKTKVKDKNSNPEPPSRRGNCRPFRGAFFFVLGILILVALWHFHPEQVAVNTTDPIQNPVGNFGVQIGYHSFKFLGGAGWLLAVAALYLSYMYLLRARRMGAVKYSALFVAMIASASLLSMQQRFFVEEAPPAETESTREILPAKFPHGPGGWVGSLIYGSAQPPTEDTEGAAPLYSGFLHDNLGTFGSALVLGISLLASILLLITGNVTETFQSFFSGFGERRKKRLEERLAKREERQKEREKRAAEKAEKRNQIQQERSEKKAPKPRRTRLSARERLDQELDEGAVKPDFTPAPAPAAAPTAPTRVAKPTKPAAKKSLPPADSVVQMPLASRASAEPEPASIAPKPKIFKSQTLRKAPAQLPQRLGNHVFPSLDLLDKPQPLPADDRENHEETAQTLIETLKTFGVEATVDEIHVGPVITRFDILPAPGTKVSRIQGLENDIAMGLKALAVRILAPVPGKGCVGVEIPNRTPQAVTLREIIESEDWVNSRAEIPIGLGKDVSGKPLVADLTKMPHLLIAGSTGSGKTVCINSIIASLL